jgi:hypothetical protein
MTGCSIPVGAGGYDFLVDPDARADQSAVFWRPDELASAVILTSAPTFDDISSISLADLPDDMVRRDADDGAHIIVRDGVTVHQIWLCDGADDQTCLAAIIPLDPSAPQRAEAALRFWRFLSDRRRRSGCSSARRVNRLVAALRALDARQSGASYREIAEALFDAERVAADPWKTSPLRDTVIRMARSGFVMMRGGYRRLLRSDRPR